MAHWNDIIFTPTDVSNCECWFDPYKGITLNGSDVSDWADQSGNGNDLAQTTATEQPFYDTTGTAPFLDCDGADESMITGIFSNSPLSQPNTIFFVSQLSRLPSSDDAIFFFDGLDTSNRQSVFGSSTGPADGYNIYAGGAGVESGSADLVTTDLNILTAIFDNGSNENKVFIDGISVLDTTSSGPDPMTGLVLGAGYFLSTSRFDGGIYEVLIYDKLLASSELNNVGEFLANKYDLTWTTIV